MKPRVLVFILSISAVALISLGIAVGFFWAERLAKSRTAESVIARVVSTIAALEWLEKDRQVPNARALLFGSIEADIYELSVLRDIPIDDASKEIRSKMIVRFAVLRRLHPRIVPEGLEQYYDEIDSYVKEYGTIPP